MSFRKISLFMNDFETGKVEEKVHSLESAITEKEFLQKINK